MEEVTEEIRENKMTPHGSPSKANVSNVNYDTMIGFDQEVETLKDKLTADSSKQLQVISIVGMAGLGKTTLARKLYNDPLIVHHFYIRGWSYASQVYQKEDLLRRILSSLTPKKDEFQTTSDDKLGEKLYRHLKGNRFLIVIDDIWNFSDWDELRKLFPNDNNGSRILFTTRIKEVAFRAEPEKPPHFLRFLTHDESWLLLQQKVFMGESCPQELVETGKRIADHCHGLPLTIVVLGGLLAKKEKKKEKRKEWWKQVAESVSSFVVGDPEQTLDLSYNHLPEYLKPCFLYLGAFPEDYEISIRKLIWLWIAEGFIEKDVTKSLEEVAEEYFLDLVNRSLVLIAKRKSTGGPRTCRLHDLLRDLCLRKANKDNFITSALCLKKAKEETDQEWYYDNEEVSSPFVPRYRQHCPCFHSCFLKLSHSLGFRKDKKKNSLLQNQEVELVSAYSCIPESSNQKRLSVHSRVFDHLSFKPFASHIHSFLCFSSEHSLLAKEKLPSMFEEFKLLKVLDLSTVRIPTFPEKIMQLTLLRYLALRGKYLSPPSSISKLCNLETLVLSESTEIYISREIWKMVKLRHLCIAGKNHVLKLSDNDCLVLENLQTLSQVNPSLECQVLLAKTPYLRKLGFCGNFTSKGKFWLPKIDFLNNLESLKLFHMTSQIWSGSYWNIRLKACCRKGLGCNIHPSQLGEVNFPRNLKRLTLSCTYLDWKEMSTIGMLPNLEALKLEYLACYGPRWETSEGGFLKLKYLRLKCMDIEEWEASQSDFPMLQHLVLHGCEKLEEIPSELGNIPTLQSIEISWCSRSTVVSARKIQEEQQSYGNDLLQVVFVPLDRLFSTDS